MTMPINIFFRLSLNSIVDLQDKKYMEVLNINSEATEGLKSQFEVAQLVVLNPNDILVEVYKSIDSVIHQYIYNSLLSLIKTYITY
jgi:hypothetical protein